MSAPEPKPLDEIAEWLRKELRRGDYVLEGVHTFDIHIPIALTEAYDLGRAERDKEWQAKMDTEGRAVVLAKLKEVVADERKALREIVRQHGCTDHRHNILAAFDARESAPAEPKEEA
jgi:hypothetical protein